MFLYHYLALIFFISAVYFSVDQSCGQDDFNTNGFKIGDMDMYNILDMFSRSQQQIVDVKVYYETFCPGSRYFLSKSLEPTVEILSKYINIHLYPYGNAETTEKDGHYEFKCQHGPEECYGNKLHACAIDILGNITQAVIYNACMMEETRSGSGSDDTAADECGKLLSIDAKPIKSCAKGDKGIQLLKYYGDESKKANFYYVPYVLINGLEFKDDFNLFMKQLCGNFTTPPPPCKQTNYIQRDYSQDRYICQSNEASAA